MSASSVATPYVQSSRPLCAGSHPNSSANWPCCRPMRAPGLAAAIDAMVASKPGATALKVGQPAPTVLASRAYRRTGQRAACGPVVLIYRGSWCPGDLRLGIREAGAAFAARVRACAVSPQSPASVPNAAITGAWASAAYRCWREVAAAGLVCGSTTMRSVMLGWPRSVRRTWRRGGSSGSHLRRVPTRPHRLGARRRRLQRPR
jgi:hypothetical protein